jgi:hypothetical protein
MVVQTTCHHAPHYQIVLVTKGTHHAHARNRSRLTSRFEEYDAGVVEIIELFQDEPDLVLALVSRRDHSTGVTAGDGDVDLLGALLDVDGVRIGY